ncbi:O-antigen ligase family protein [Rhizobium sp. KVB221]|uniref:O-antigen ligase family protein n=1 Tax=Rhizobium setariae TaxID=2801340 RepID=A0A937CP30_9HYPH|nr:O-antigen ligase family protein [Rhizobium setariae]MBL0371347.1 O-antigen ligase family protein [Rhizobium setariae]
MSTVTTHVPATFRPGRATLRLIGSGLVAFGVFLSGFVIDEPAPYEIFMAALIGFWFIMGLRISRTTGALLAFMLIYMVGGFLTITQMEEIGDAPMYLAVTLFLALSSVFYCAIIEEDHRRLKLIFNAWTAAAVVTSMLGILGYFKAFPGAEAFTRYDRAMGAFQDPNVFGPFLVAPSLYLLHGILTGKLKHLPIRGGALAIIAFGVLLSFSRAAWAMFAFSAAMMVLLMLIKERSGAFRLKVLVLTLAGVIFCVVGIIVALQIPQVADLLTSRTKLVQDYDGDRLGRFERHQIGFLNAMSQPLGIGPMVFSTMFPEDEHNIWLKSLTSYGWLGFVTYIGLVWTTLWFGLRNMFRDRPWQPYLLAAWITLCGHELIGNVIDTDHWRHHFVLFGIVWGCAALEHKYQRQRSSPALIRT